MGLSNPHICTTHNFVYMTRVWFRVTFFCWNNVCTNTPFLSELLGIGVAAFSYQSQIVKNSEKNWAVLARVEIRKWILFIQRVLESSMEPLPSVPISSAWVYTDRCEIVSSIPNLTWLMFSEKIVKKSRAIFETFTVSRKSITPRTSKWHVVLCTHKIMRL